MTPEEITIAGLADDPHPLLASLRARTPVAFVPVLRAWLVTNRALALEVMRDDETFTVDDPRFTTGRVVGPSMLSRDGGEHARHRAPFARPFRLAATRERLAHVVTAEAGRLARDVAVRGGGDLRLELAAPLAARVMLEALGVAHVESGTVLGWYREIVSAVDGLGAGVEPPPSAARAVDALAAAIRAAGLPQAPPSLLRDAAAHAADVSPDELASNAAVLLFGGIETTEGQIASLLLQLLADGGALERVRRDAGVRANALEESLRLEPAAAQVDRYATRDVTIGGAAIRAGDMVSVSLAGANRDPAVWPDPDRFRPERENARLHLAFAQGPHVCLGMHLARIEMAAALDAVLEHLPQVRLDPAVESRIRGLVFRKPERLAVLVA